MALRIRLYCDIDQMNPGSGPAGLGGLNANDPGYGQTATPGQAGNTETIRFQTSSQVYGTPGSVTLAQLLTAMTTAINNLAGATGTPIITADLLAQINAWNTGNP